MRIINKFRENNRTFLTCECICKNIFVIRKDSKRDTCGCKGIVGKIFGRLAIEKVFYKNKKLHAECLCSCGNTYIGLATSIKGGNTKSCGCLVIEELKNRAYKPGKVAKLRVLDGYRKGAKQRKLEFSISDEVAYELMKKNCHYCGNSPSRIRKVKGSKGSFTYNGIDRKNNSLGYLKENCVTCCTECNFIKSDTNYDEFVSWINKVYKVTKQIKPEAEQSVLFV